MATRVDGLMVRDALLRSAPHHEAIAIGRTRVHHTPLIPVPAGVYHRAALRADPLAWTGSSRNPALGPRLRGDEGRIGDIAPHKTAAYGSRASLTLARDDRKNPCAGLSGMRNADRRGSKYGNQPAGR